jgi:hypothetical protein
MRIAYWSTDPVNLDLARNYADERALTLCPMFPRDRDAEETFDAAIYDLDFLGPDLRRRILADLSFVPHQHPVAVHSFNLEEFEIALLRKQGVAVRRRLEIELFELLCRPALAQPA